ncbi:MAG: FAD-dependent oxidoreductase [Chitinophagales bacterium]|nr:FAD-dependent oxidoreductase [Bacteroidota bacterium]MCB9042163.1 FAD-dependent oxidoreductase [Chitinophagales bacterium]
MNYSFVEAPFLGKSLNRRPVNIVGAGISGLLLGFFLKKQGIPFKIWEKNDTAGGLLGTLQTPYGIAEKAANGFLWSDSLVQICEHLKLKIIPPSTISKKRYIYYQKNLRPLPVSWQWVVQAGLRSLRPHKIQTYETVADWGNAFLGEKITQNLLSPALSGIYAALPEELSFPAIFPSLAKALTQKRSLLQALLQMRNNTSAAPAAYKGTLSFENGMQTLIDALQKHLQNDIAFNTNITECTPHENWVLCCPAGAAQKLIDEPYLYNDFSAIRYADIHTFTVFIPRENWQNQPQGFGCLIPRGQNFNILGAIFNDQLFPNRTISKDLISITCIMRDFDGSFSNISESNLLQQVQQEIDRLFAIQSNTIQIQHFHWKNGIPIYSPQLFNAWYKIHEFLHSSFSAIRLFGNYTGGISIRQMASNAEKIATLAAQN